MQIVQRGAVTAFITADGSQIRELLNPSNSAARNQSLAEATLPVDGATREHYHPQAEEFYYILEGQGRLRLEEHEQAVKPGDAIAIPPGHKHKIWNTGSTPLIFLCCCAPPYTHEDTILTE